MLSLIVVALLGQQGVCKAGMPCKAASFQSQRNPLDTCTPLSDGGYNLGTKGLLEFDFSDGGYVFCDGKRWFSAKGGITSVTATLPLSSSGGATPNISSTAASASTSGYLANIAGELIVDAGFTSKKSVAAGGGGLSSDGGLSLWDPAGGSAVGTITNSGGDLFLSSNTALWSDLFEVNPNGLFQFGTGGVLGAAPGLSIRAVGLDSATSVATTINSSLAWTNASAKLASWQNNAVEKAYLSWAGEFNGNGVTGTRGVAFTANLASAAGCLVGADNAAFTGICIGSVASGAKSDYYSRSFATMRLDGNNGVSSPYAFTSTATTGNTAFQSSTGALTCNGTGGLSCSSYDGTNWQNTVPVGYASGGTATSVVPPSGGVAYGTGTAISYTDAGSTYSGSCLINNGTGQPQWGPCNQTNGTVDGGTTTSGSSVVWGWVTRDIASTLTQQCAADFTIPMRGGLKLGTTCSVGVALSGAGGAVDMQYFAWASDTTTCSVRACCNGASATCDPANQLYTCSCIIPP